MTKTFDFLMRPKRTERLDNEGNPSRGRPEERGPVPRGWVCWADADRTLAGGVEACVGTRTERLGHHENHSENDRSAAVVEWICHD